MHKAAAEFSCLCQDDDGSAYIAYSSEDNRVMHIAQLSKDYAQLGKQYIRTMVGCSASVPPASCLTTQILLIYHIKIQLVDMAEEQPT